MCKLKEALTVVAHHRGFPGMGFKAAAKSVALPYSSMRYAMQAYNEGHIAAVSLGTITDQRVIGMLHGLPPAVAQTISRIETKLRRHLGRRRLLGLIQMFWIIHWERTLTRFSMPWVEEGVLQ